MEKSTNFPLTALNTHQKMVDDSIICHCYEYLQSVNQPLEKRSQPQEFWGHMCMLSGAFRFNLCQVNLLQKPEVIPSGIHQRCLFDICTKSGGFGDLWSKKNMWDFGNHETLLH